jgi:hypothetical protein
MSYEWRPGALEENLDVGERPERLANSVVAIVMDGTKVSLLNPHPESWNNWQLPYASFSSDVSPDRLTSFHDIETTLNQALDLSEPEVRKSASEQISEMLGEAVELHGQPVFETYALRFSKTADVWTAYRFVYVRASLSSSTEPAIQSTRVDLADKDEVGRAHGSGTVDGLPLSDNVALILGDETIIDAIIAG